MLRAIGIPTVGGVELEHFSNFPGETILVNGYDGSILLNPSEGSTKRVFQVARDLDAGPIDELRAKYGNVRDAESFVHSEDLIPSITFKPKKDAKGLVAKKINITPST